MNYELLATLLVGHIIGDFALQTDTVYRLKTQGGVSGLLIHVAIHLVVTALIIQGGWEKWALLAVLGVAHFSVDWLKLRAQSRPAAPAFIIDQLAHFMFLILFTLMMPTLNGIVPAPWLYLVLIYGLIPVVTMCLWVWAHDKTGTHRDSARWASWRTRMKIVSQATGWPLNLLLAVMVFQTYFLELT